MTHNQIAFHQAVTSRMNVEEGQRHNRATEAIQTWYNTQQVELGKEANALQARSINETNRHNRAMEMETYRNNVATARLRERELTANVFLQQQRNEIQREYNLSTIAINRRNQEAQAYAIAANVRQQQINSDRNYLTTQQQLYDKRQAYNRSQDFTERETNRQFRLKNLESNRNYELARMSTQSQNELRSAQAKAQLANASKANFDVFRASQMLPFEKQLVNAQVQQTKADTRYKEHKIDYDNKQLVLQTGDLLQRAYGTYSNAQTNAKNADTRAAGLQHQIDFDKQRINMQTGEDILHLINAGFNQALRLITIFGG